VLLKKSWNKPDNTGCNNSTRAIEHFGQILGKLNFKCRQLQVPILPGPILCRFVHLMFVRVSTQTKARTTQVGPQARGSHVLWQSRAEQGTNRRTPSISPESRPVVSALNVFELLIPPGSDYPSERSELKNRLFREFGSFQRKRSRWVRLFDQNTKPLPGFVKEAEKSLWLFDSF
jgi:hypothetical protein